MMSPSNGAVGSGVLVEVEESAHGHAYKRITVLLQFPDWGHIPPANVVDQCKCKSPVPFGRRSNIAFSSPDENGSVRHLEKGRRCCQRD